MEKLAVTIRLLNILPENLLPTLHTAMRVMGLLPESRAGLCYSAFVSLFMLFNSAPSLIDLYLRRYDLIHIVTNLGLTMVLFGAYVAHFLMLLKTRMFQSVIKEAMVDYELISTRESAVRYLRQSHVLLLVLTLLIWATVTAYAFEPIMNQSGELVFPGWYPFSTQNTVTYSLIFVYQIFSGALAGILILVATLLFCELNLHVCMHLENLCLSIREALKPENYQPDVDMEKEMNIRLAGCVKRHLTLLRRITELATALEAAGSLDYAFCVIAVATVALQTIIVVESVSLLQQVKSIALMLSTVVELFPPCLTAQQTIEMQLKLADATFEYQVIKAPDSVKRTLQIMNNKFQEATQTLSLFGLVDANLVTYAHALKMSYGIFTLLLHFKD